MTRFHCLALLVLFVASSALPAPVAAWPVGAGALLPAIQATGGTTPQAAAPGLSVPTVPVFSGSSSASTPALAGQAPGAVNAAAPLCRLGVGAVRQNINNYALNAPAALAGLRAGWYETWNTDPNPAHPNGMEMVQTINLHQWKWENNQFVLYSAIAPYAVPYTYSMSPSPAELPAKAAAAPGSLWLVGNEIERRDWGTSGQNEILPELYAQAYHDAYQAIKQADPTARVANGSVIAPTPLRLQYLSRVWDEYQRRYGIPMPVDVWNIHLYMGPEVRGGWGIDVPAGIDNVSTGMWVFAGDLNQADEQLLVNKDFTQVPPLVVAFRTWMRAHGQQNKPLLITEFGVNMPDWVWPDHFRPDQVYNEYMLPGLNYLQTAADASLGYPADENHLVQAVNWYSLDGDAGKWVNDDPNYPGQWVFHQFFNGNLMNSGLNTQSVIGLSTLGNYWTGYVTPIAPTVNLRALQVSGPPPFSSGGGLATAHVTFVFSNSGNVNFNQPIVVSVYDGANNQPLASATINGLPGCGHTAKLDFDWPNLTPGYHPLRATVYPLVPITETNTSDNQVLGGVLVATNHYFLPLVGH